MVHPEVLAGAPYRSSRAGAVLLGLVGVGLGLVTLVLLGGAVLALAFVFPTALFLVIPLWSSGFLLSAQVLLLSSAGVGLLALASSASRSLR